LRKFKYFDFLYGASKAQTLIPAVAGRNGVMGKVLEKNGIKRLFRLYSNHRITNAKMLEFYSTRLLTILLPPMFKLTENNSIKDEIAKA